MTTQSPAPDAAEAVRQAPALDPEALRPKFEAWREVVERMHEHSVFTPNPYAAWTPLRRPLSACVAALVTTAGAHRKDQPAFDLADPHGDSSYRVIPAGTPASELMASHGHYDTTDANADINVILPLDALARAQARGRIGAVAPFHLGFMGWIPDGRPLREGSATEAAGLLRQAEVDVVVLSPG